MAKPVPIELEPGYVQTDSSLTSAKRYVGGNNVRFYRGRSEKIGGNVVLTFSPMTGVPRGMVTWNDLTARELIGAGTATNLYAIPNTGYYPLDITPVGFTAGNVNPLLGFGWGASSWGSGTWGTPRLQTTFEIDPLIWSIDNFGKILYAAPSDGPLYSWDPTVSPVVPAALVTAVGSVTGPPAQMRGFYITEERFLIAFGTPGPAGEPTNLMRIYWCAQGVPTDWSVTHTPAELAQLPGAPAGSRQLQVGTKIVAGADLGNQISLIWTDAALYAHQYTGSQFTFNTQLVGEKCGLLSRYAFTVVAGAAFWMSNGNFWMYNGGLLRIPNSDDITEWFFAQMRDESYSTKSFAYFNSRFSEIWFVIVPFGAAEPSLAAVFNIKDQFWFSTSITPRSAATTFSLINEDPILAGGDGNVYQHEQGVDDNGSPLAWSLSTGLLEIDAGDQSFDIFGFMPDMERQIGAITLAITTFDRTPTGTLETQSKTFGPSDGLVDFRLSGREASITLSQDILGGDFRLGLPKLEIQPSAGERR